MKKSFDRETSKKDVQTPRGAASPPYHEISLFFPFFEEHFSLPGTLPDPMTQLSPDPKKHY
jgi:hypothetical protein